MGGNIFKGYNVDYSCEQTLQQLINILNYGVPNACFASQPHCLNSTCGLPPPPTTTTITVPFKHCIEEGPQIVKLKVVTMRINVSTCT